MKNHNEFWQRPVIGELILELVPGEHPRLLINHKGQTVLQLEFSEARRLIEALTVAVGELLILQKDPDALTRVQKLLADDVTFNDDDNGRQSVPMTFGSEGYLKAQDFIRRYKSGGRSFPKADLCGADLQGADLRGVDLRGADLVGANLKRANLFQANLERANLSQANLEEAGLFQTNLRGADLTRASLERTFFGQADLEDAQVTDEQLALAKVLSGTVLPDGTKRD